MLLTGLSDQLFDIKGLALAGIKLTYTDFDFGAQLSQSIEMLKQFAPQLLLHRFGKLGCP